MKLKNKIKAVDVRIKYNHPNFSKFCSFPTINPAVKGPKAEPSKPKPVFSAIRRPCPSFLATKPTTNGKSSATTQAASRASSITSWCGQKSSLPAKSERLIWLLASPSWTTSPSSWGGVKHRELIYDNHFPLPIEDTSSSRILRGP